VKEVAGEKPSKTLAPENPIGSMKKTDS